MAIKKAEDRYGPSGKYHVRFLNGHDNQRIASIAAQDPKLGCRWSAGCRDADLPPLAYTDPQVYSSAAGASLSSPNEITAVTRHQLALGVLDADLDLHGWSSRWISGRR